MEYQREMVSVIVPVYNVEKYLRRCIDSILAQTFSDFELILVDDGSTDKSPQICDEYKSLDARVRVIHQINQGQAVARNKAVDESGGEWVCFVDGDDLIHPQTLELLYEAAVKDDSLISMCSLVEGTDVPSNFYDLKKFSSSCRIIDEDTIKELYKFGEHRMWVSCGKLIRKEILNKYPFTVGKIYEDNAVVCKWIGSIKQISDVKEKLYFYTTNINGTTKSEFSAKKLDYLWALEEILNFYHHKGYTVLWQAFCVSYMKTSIEYRYKVLNVLKDCFLAQNIVKSMRKVYWKNRCGKFMSSEEKRRFFEVAYPRMLRIMDKAQFFMKKNKK